MKTEFLTKCFPNLEKKLVQEIEEFSSLKTFDEQEYIVKQGKYVKFLPILQNGCIKVFCKEDSIDFLLYFIKPGASCIFSFAHVHDQKPLEFMAVAELKSTVLLLPIDKVRFWIKEYPSLNSIILNSYKEHYNELLNTTKQIICYNLEERLISYLKVKSELKGSSIINTSHKDIANDLGTSREVISRLMKKLSHKGIVKQQGRTIEVL